MKLLKELNMKIKIFNENKTNKYKWTTEFKKFYRS